MHINFSRRITVLRFCIVGLCFSILGTSIYFLLTDHHDFMYTTFEVLKHSFIISGVFMVQIGVLNAFFSALMVCSLKIYFRYFYDKHKYKIVVGGCIQSITVFTAGVYKLS